MSQKHIKNLHEAMVYFRDQAEPATAYERDADAIEWALGEIERLQEIVAFYQSERRMGSIVTFCGVPIREAIGILKEHHIGNSNG